MKIYVVGSVASGKTTFAKKISNELEIHCTHLDSVVHVNDKENREWGNTKRTEEEITQLFEEVISKQNWIIEDAGRKQFRNGMEVADLVVHLKPSRLVKKKRILTRYFRQKMGLEDCLYTPSLHMLKFLFRALNKYETGEDDLEIRLNQYKHKTVILKNSNEVKHFIRSLKEENEARDKLKVFAGY